MLRGLEAQQAAWRAAVAAQLHHAWLLSGPRGVGKAGFAAWAGSVLLGAEDSASMGAKLIAARSHPDYKLVEREVWDRSTPPRIVPHDQRRDDAPARSIRIVQVRALEPLLALAPSLSPRRVVIIDAIDDLERAGANALLKMLEEPPAGTVFLLVNHVAGRLLPTIRSRCRVLRFPPLSNDVMTAIIRDHRPDIAAIELTALLATAQGVPGLALSLAGSDIAGLDGALTRLAASGDPTNVERSQLARALATKASIQRYETFLQRAPAFIAERARALKGERLADALRQWERARHLAAIAGPQSLVAETVVFELAGCVAALAGEGGRAKA